MTTFLISSATWTVAWKKEAQEKIKFSFNRCTRKVTVDVKGGANVWFTGDIAAALGFDQDAVIEKKVLSSYMANVDFIDSLQFMNASLDKLVSNLSKNGADKFSTLKKHINNDKISLLLRKGICP